MTLALFELCVKEIILGSADSTAAANFKYLVSGKVMSITYLGTGLIHEEIERILRWIEHWHRGSIESFRILYPDAAGLGGEVKWDRDNEEIVAAR
jgi:hypothetical protein